MPYDVVISPQALEDLRRLRPHVRARVRDGLALYLSTDPTRVSRSRIKRLAGMRSPEYRLRMDDTRIYYNVRGRVVDVVAVVPKWASSAWLVGEGEPDEGSSTD